MPLPPPEGTRFGFFGTPPIASFEGILAHFARLSEHADFVLVQQNVPWAEFAGDTAAETQSRTDIENQVILLEQNGLDAVFVIDPLNGLNRREFHPLPDGWTPSFSDPNVRTAMRSFALWIVRSFKPYELGLASEINTYADAFPEDFPHFVSLYHEIYALIKAESPRTRVFVSFQWEDLNNRFPGAAEGRVPGETNWEQVEVFEPNLDLWAISSYPYFVYPAAAEIPADYYTALLERTDKPLAVAEGGYTSVPVGSLNGDPQDQVGYLHAIHDQLGARLDFWVYLLLSDLNTDSYARALEAQDNANFDLEAFSWFVSLGLTASDGTPKPALDVWNDLRGAP